MKITSLAPWFGSNRMLAHRVGEMLTPAGASRPTKRPRRFCS